MRLPHNFHLLAALVAAIASPAWAQECPAPVAAAAPVVRSDNRNLPFDITSGSAEVSRAGDAELRDGVTVTQGDARLTAQSATFSAQDRAFTVKGEVQYSDPQLRIKGDSGNWSDTAGGVFRGTEFELPTQPARGTADELALDPSGEIRLKQVSYTACPAGQDDWFLRASSIEIDQKSQQGTGRNVRVELKGIPILYAPVISFPVGEARKSGFLFPAIGTSNRSGFELGIPYYFNLAPQYDLTLTPRLLSRRGAGLDAQFRYLSSQSEGRFQGSLIPDDDLARRDRGLARLLHQTHFSDRLRLQLDLSQASDTRYFEDFGLGPDGTSVTFLDRYLHLAWLGEGWRLDGRLQDYQTIDPTVAATDRPYSRLPQLALNGNWPLAGSGLRLGLNSELVYFDRDTGVTGGRFDIAPRLSWPLAGRGWFLEPSAAWRMTAWELADTAPGVDDSPMRNAPVLAVNGGMIFERNAGSREQWLQTLEPRVLYSYIPYREQSALPVFDGGLPDLNLVQLFRVNRFLGADRLGDANELAVGLTSRLLDRDSGRQYLSATVGQRFYFDPPRVTLPGQPADTRNASNLVGEISLTAFANWSVNLGLEWDASASNTVLGQAGLQYRPGRDTVVNVGYRYREGRLEQWDASAAWRLSPRWQIFVRQVQSLRDKTSIDSFAGFEYGGCCWRLRLVGRRYISNRTGEHDTSVALTLELKGLSSVGTDDTFLRRGIRGYSPDSP